MELDHEAWLIMTPPRRGSARAARGRGVLYHARMRFVSVGLGLLLAAGLGCAGDDSEARAPAAGAGRATDTFRYVPPEPPVLTGECVDVGEPLARPCDGRWCLQAPDATASKRPDLSDFR